jgi:hypothetical protein
MKKESFKWGLAGALIILSVTAILSETGLGASLGEDENILFFSQIVSILAAIVSAVGLVLPSTDANFGRYSTHKGPLRFRGDGKRPAPKQP